MAHTELTKEKIRNALLGNKNSKGIKPSAETKEKIRQTKIGNRNPNFGKPAHNRGKAMSTASKAKLSLSRKGIPSWNKGTKGVQVNINTSGLEKGRGWNKGHRKPEDQCLSTRNARIRSSVEYALWRTAVFTRDMFTCIWCGSKKKLQADHIRPFAYFPELRFAIDNGRTLCSTCHKTTDTYGNKARHFNRMLN